MGGLAPYPREQLFKEKIRISKLHEGTYKHRRKFGETMPPGIKRMATFSIKYENGKEFDMLTFDVMITDETHGEVKVFISDPDKKCIRGDWRMKKKVYCNDCGYCGEPIYFEHSIEMAHMPPVILKNLYSHGIEIEQRYCNNPDVPNIEEIDTFYTPIKNNYNPRCHELNNNNQCKYFKKKGD